jgi:hypothetical protein
MTIAHDLDALAGTGSPHGGIGDLAVTGSALADRVRRTPGVLDVVAPSTGFAHWFGEPAVQLLQEDHDLAATVCIVPDSRIPEVRTCEQVSEVLRSTLEEWGFGVGRVSVQVVRTR